MPTAAKRPKPNPAAIVDGELPSDETLIDHAGRGMAQSIGAARMIMSSVEEQLKAGEATPGLMREAATVMRSIVSLSAELRQREKHVRDVVALMTSSEEEQFLLAMIARTSHDTLKKIRSLVEELDTGSIL